MEEAYLRQISRDEFQRVTTLQSTTNGDAIGTTLEFGARRNIYNLEVNNPNNSAETLYLYVGDTTTNQRTQKRQITLGARAYACFFINIRSPVIIYTPTDNRTTPLSNILYGAVEVNPINVAISYYDEFPR